MGVYTDYFQKSKVFLYPLLRLKKGLSYVPIQTYVAWESVYSTEDCRFFCEYKTKRTKKFEKFGSEYLRTNPLFDDYIELEENKHLYIFDFTTMRSDFNRFIAGKYSQLTLESKIAIIDFFSDQGKTGEYIQGFLSPEDLHADYADFLGVDIETVKKVYEICTPPDLEKETLIDNNHLIYQLLKRDSISLSK
tara:strand:+ start:646 stop:1221 length:576 start_codon:yes stop_codon:yes gene_type:complete